MHADRDLTPILERVARAHYQRALTALPEADQSTAPDWADVPAATKAAIKTSLLPLVTDVIAALDAHDEETLFAGLEAQFRDTALPEEQGK